MIGGEGEPEDRAAPARKPTPQTLEPVGSLEAQAAPFEVALTWDASPGDLVADTYSVYRDGSLLEEVPAGTLAFTDETALPEQAYEYSVRASQGDVSADEVTVSVATPPGPLRLARVSGTYDTRAKTASRSGYDRYPANQTSAWSFQAQCGKGACDVSWRDLASKGKRIRLERKGATYTALDLREHECPDVGLRGRASLTDPVPHFVERFVLIGVS